MSIKSVSIKSIAFAAAIATLPVLALGAFTASSAFAKGQGGDSGSGSGDGGSISTPGHAFVPNNTNKRPTLDEDRGCFTLIDNRRTGRVIRGSCMPVL